MAQRIKHDQLILDFPWPAKYKTTLVETCKRDSNGKNYFTKDAASLDVDTYEKDRSGRPDMTMDCVLGMSDFERPTRYSNNQLLMVELRLNYIEAGNVGYTAIHGKVSHTKDLLLGHKVADDVYFLFTDQECPMAKYVFNQWKNSHSEARNWMVLNPSDFENFIIKEEKDVPYVPINKPEEIQDSITACKDFDAVEKALGYWKKQAENYRDRYNFDEVDNIKANLSLGWHEIDWSKFKGDDTDKMLIDIYFNDVMNIKGR